MNDETSVTVATSTIEKKLVFCEKVCDGGGVSPRHKERNQRWACYRYLAFFIAVN